MDGFCISRYAHRMKPVVPAIEKHDFDDAESGYGSEPNVAWQHVEDIDETQLSMEELQVLGRLRNELNVITKEFSQVFFKALHEERARGAAYSDDMEAVLKKNYFDRPLFEIMHGKQAQESLDKTADQYDVEHAERIKNDHGEPFPRRELLPNSFLVTFQLPKPLQVFWGKYEMHKQVARVRFAAEHEARDESVFESDRDFLTYLESLEKSREEIDGTKLLQWGKIYMKAVSVVRAMKEKLKIPGEIYFHRVNEQGQHGQDFFYVWEVNAEHLGDIWDADTDEYYKSRYPEETESEYEQ